MYIKEEGGPEKRKQFNLVLKACTSEICVQSTLDLRAETGTGMTMLDLHFSDLAETKILSTNF